jgi:hypothetical protein
VLQYVIHRLRAEAGLIQHHLCNSQKMISPAFYTPKNISPGKTLSFLALGQKGEKHTPGVKPFFHFGAN